MENSSYEANLAKINEKIGGGIEIVKTKSEEESQELAKTGEVDGFVFHCSNLLNKDLPAVEYARAWFAAHADEPRETAVERPVPDPVIPQSADERMPFSGAGERQLLCSGDGRVTIVEPSGRVPWKREGCGMVSCVGLRDGFVYWSGSGGLCRVRYALPCDPHAAAETLAEGEVRGFDFVERDGRLYGRGVADCKANAVVCAETLVALSGKVSVGCIFTADEEIGGFTTALMLKRGYRPRRMVIVSDLAEYGLCNAHKGHAVLRLVAHGSEGHSSQPWASDNALEKLIAGCAALRREWDRTHAAATAADCWHDTIAITLASSSSKVVNAIPARAEAQVSLRYVDLDGCQKAVAFIREVSGLDVEVVRDGGPVNADAADPLMTRFLGLMRQAWKDPALKFHRMDGATDARHFGALGLPVVICGSEAGAPHADGEWIDPAGLDRLRSLLLAFLENSSRN